MAQIQTTAYSRELQKQLFPDSEFYKKSVSETGIAADAETFEIPNLTDIDEAIIGKPTVLPLPVKTDDDTKVTGTMKTIRANPLVITDPEEIVLNYNKRQNKQMQQSAAINARSGDYAVKQWLPLAATTNNIIVTTGSSRASSVTGVTGTRKAMTKADLLGAKKRLMLDNVTGVKGELFALLTVDAYNDLLNIAEFVDYDKLGVESKLKEGILGRIVGFNIMSRSKAGHIGALYTAANAPIFEVATAATDRPVSILWHDKMVSHAEAHAKTYVNADDATYQGTVISASVRFGAEKNRTDDKGTVAIAEIP